MAEYRVIDSHVHFWNPDLLRYPWLDDLPVLRRSFLPPDYQSLGSGATSAVVFVEANCEPAQNLEEVAFVERLASEDSRIAGIVAFVELQDEQLTSSSLDRLVERRLVVGVRHNIQGHPAGFALTTSFVRGVRQVGKRWLPFDLCVTASQLAEATELVKRCPDTRFVLDHCGKPAIRDDALDSWAADLSKLAEHENVVCKLSGLLTEMDAEQDIEAVLEPYLDHVWSCFGVDRLMYGSDWPVVTLRSNERLWRERIQRFTATWSEGEQQQFYSANARRIYDIEGRHPGRHRT